MLQTLNPYTSTAKTAEIMARYRPIAPRPQANNSLTTSSNGGAGAGAEGDGSSGSASGSGSGSMSPTIRRSPYLRNVWPHLQSRPTRTRKRGRTSLGPPPPTTTTFKRPRTLLQGLSPPFHITTTTTNLPIQGFAPPPPATATTTTTTLVTLPLLPCSSPHHHMQLQPNNNVIDLNKVVVVADIPEEKDLLAQLQKPTKTDVISPRPIRLIPSTVTIRAIKPDTCPAQISLKKAAEEVEEELESQVLPAFVSDSCNRVRLVNSAYKEMVGQPECPWLESMITCKTICGEVVLDLTDDVGVGGFSCWARIEWGGMNGKKKLVNAFGEAMRLECESKDYKFAWRFHTREASEAASNV